MKRANLRVLVLGAAVATAAGALVFAAPAVHASHISYPNGTFVPPQYVGEIDVGTAYDMALNGTHIFAADDDNDRIRIFDMSGNPAGTIGSAGVGPGHLNEPKGVAVNSTHIFVADYSNDRIQIFNHAGNYANSFGTRGDDPGHLNGPIGVAVNSTHIFVADHSNHRVQIFDHAGNHAGMFGTRGDDPGQFVWPWGIAVNSTHIFVADSGNYRIQIFDLSGNHAKSLGSRGTGPGELGGIIPDVAVNPAHIFVADNSNDRIQIFDHAGNHVGAFGTKSYNSGPGRFLHIDSVAVNPTHIFVSDGVRDHIQIFALSEPQDAAPAPPAAPAPTTPPEPAFPTTPTPEWLGMSNWTAGVVTQNVDGNTVEIDHLRIRLPLVNVFGSGNSTAPHAKLAEQLCPVGSPAWYRIDSMQPNGSHGHTMATVWCEAGHLDSALLASGLGYISTHWCDRSEYGTAYWASPCWFRDRN